MENADTQQFLFSSSLEVDWAKPVSIFSTFPPKKKSRWTGKTGDGNLSCEPQHLEECLERRRVQKSKQDIKSVPLPTNK